MKNILRKTLLIITISTSLFAKTFEISISNKGENFFEVVGQDLLINTNYCFEYPTQENAILIVNETSRTLLFVNSNKKCNVDSIYAKVKQSAGQYNVSITSTAQLNWFQIMEQNFYLKTNVCLSLGINQDAKLVLNSNGTGIMYEGLNQCLIQGIYSKIDI